MSHYGNQISGSGKALQNSASVALSGFRKAKQHRSSRGFTLIEILVVAALIAIFSAIAIISVQTQLINNRRKAIIGESRQIATAMDFAYNDVGFFPSIAFLDETAVTLELQSEFIFGDSDEIYARLQHYLIPNQSFIQTQKQFNGPYISSTQGRSRVSQGLGGSRRMLIFNGIPGANDPQGVDWPVDAVNNPWVMYNLHLDRSTSSLYFTTNSEDDSSALNLTKPSATGNFINAIVSYGENQVPGGGPNYNPTGDVDAATANSPQGLRLYYGNPNQSANPLTLHTIANGGLTGTNGNLRASAWTAQFFQNAGGGAGTLALTDDNSASVGITDDGSDDIVFSF